MLFRYSWLTVLGSLITTVYLPADDNVDPLIARPQLPDEAEVGFAELLDRGYTPLFNGQDLSGWQNPYEHGQAQVVNGEIHLTGENKFFLVTDKQYADFRLVVEIRLPEGPANSGVMFRCHVDRDADPPVFGYQAECDGSDRRWSGGLYDESRRGWIWPSTTGRSTEQFLKHADQSQQAFTQPRVRDALNRNGWNRYEILCIQDRISITLNGVETTSFRDDMDSTGFIGIQHHGEKGQTYRFRNLFVKQLPEIPARDHVRLFEQSPVAVTKIDDRVTLLDFGEVAFGNVVMPIPAGDGEASLHFGERLLDGRVDRKPPGTVRYGVTYISPISTNRDRLVIPAPADRRNTEQVAPTGSHPPAVLTPPEWQPVMPFRWVELAGLNQDFPLDKVRRQAAYSATWNDDAAHFECSSPVLNDIWKLCKYSIKATTFAGVYVDGDRERIPYEADAYLNQLSHYATDDNVSMAANTFDWLMENGTWPTEWSPHMIFMAHAEWMHSGDLDWLRHRYESLKTKTLFHRVGEDGLVRSGPADRSRHDIVDWPAAERDGYVFTEVNTVVNAFHLEAIRRMAEMADAVGNTDDATAFRAQREKAIASFHRLLFDSQRNLFRDGKGTDHTSLHANLFPLAFNLVPEDQRSHVAEWLGNQGMRCSVYAAQYLLDGLFANGADTVALQLITADGDRSWKHMVQSGTTITWEAWDLKYKPNQDWNHAWGAAPANLLPRHVLGIQPQRAGWERVSVRPCPGNLKSAQGRVPTGRGPIDVSWVADESFRIDLTLPEGVVGDVELPAADGDTGVRINGASVLATRRGERWVIDAPVRGTVTIKGTRDTR
ncbi:MAG: family 78 glycoside hydrolase catalytic domain [Planctomycetales bacterium]|nr:family 78 glycoside hydrolase catalytic domain [Planctomycetales bacterium]